MSGIPSDQVLAILRLRQWAVERTALKCGRSTRLTNAGWRERRETDADARNVRVIDFEKALATLDTAHQYALVLTYRDRVGHAATAAAIGCSIRGHSPTCCQQPAADSPMCSTAATSYDAAIIVFVDPLAKWNFILTVVSAVAAVAAALIGGWTLYYAKRGPSKDDIQRVEVNTAETSRHIEAVRGHLAGQEERTALQNRANRVSIAVSAQGPGDQPLSLHFVLNDPAVVLQRIDLINERDMLAGFVECVAAEPLTFTATVDPRLVERWFQSGRTDGHLNWMLLNVRAYIGIGAEDAARTFAVRLIQASNDRSWILDGWC